MKVIKSERQHACFECGKMSDYGISREGFGIFRVVCKSCMKEWVSALTEFLERDKEKEKEREKEQ